MIIIFTQDDLKPDHRRLPASEIKQIHLNDWSFNASVSSDLYFYSDGEGTRCIKDRGAILSSISDSDFIQLADLFTFLANSTLNCAVILFAFSWLVVTKIGT